MMKRKIALTALLAMFVNVGNTADILCWPEPEETPPYNEFLTPTTSLRTFLFAHANEKQQLLQLATPDRLYRVCAYSKSYGIQVYVGPSADALVYKAQVPPGSCADVEAEVLGIGDTCPGPAGRHRPCYNNPPIFQRCLKKDGTEVKRYYFYARGWAVAHDDFAPQKLPRHASPEALISLHRTYKGFPGVLTVVSSTTEHVYGIIGGGGLTAVVDGNRVALHDPQDLSGKTIEILVPNDKVSRDIHFFRKTEAGD